MCIRDRAKYKLPSNGDLADQAPLERRKLQGIDRHWTPEQFAAFVTACRAVSYTHLDVYKRQVGVIDFLLDDTLV